jgi:hypothetical protein
MRHERMVRRTGRHGILGLHANDTTLVTKHHTAILVHHDSIMSVQVRPNLWPSIRCHCSCLQQRSELLALCCRCAQAVVPEQIPARSFIPSRYGSRRKLGNLRIMGARLINHGA